MGQPERHVRHHELARIASGRRWDVSQLYTTGVLSVLPAFAADFDEDTDVDAMDLTRWKTGFGLSTAATHMQGNADGDADVDGADFLTWQQQLGSAAASASSAAVPEPTTALLLTGVAALVIVHRRGRVRREVMS